MDFHFADSIIYNLRAGDAEEEIEEAPQQENRGTSEHPSVQLYTDCIQQLELFKLDMLSRFGTDIASF